MGGFPSVQSEAVRGRGFFFLIVLLNVPLKSRCCSTCVALVALTHTAARWKLFIGSVTRH